MPIAVENGPAAAASSALQWRDGPSWIRAFWSQSRRLLTATLPQQSCVRDYPSGPLRSPQAAPGRTRYASPVPTLRGSSRETLPFFRNAMNSSLASGSRQRTVSGIVRDIRRPRLFNLSPQRRRRHGAAIVRRDIPPVRRRREEPQRTVRRERSRRPTVCGFRISRREPGLFRFLHFRRQPMRRPRTPCHGTTTVYVIGDDGDTQSGSPLAFVDNGDGTITDLNTRLMWEKKDDSGGLHDKDMNAVWDHLLPGSIWQWIVQVNSETVQGSPATEIGDSQCERTPKHRGLRPRLDSLAVCGNIGLQPTARPGVHQRLQLHRPLSLLDVHNPCEWNRGSVWAVNFSNGEVSHGADRKRLDGPCRPSGAVSDKSSPSWVAPDSLERNKAKN